MEDPVQNCHISCRSYNKYGRLRQFLFVIGQLKQIFYGWLILRTFSPLEPLCQMNQNLVWSGQEDIVDMLLKLKPLPSLLFKLNGRYLQY